MILAAMIIASRAHKGQVDKGGKPYITHPIAVAAQQKTEEGKIVALLHDVVEDSYYTFDDLKNAGFSSNVLEALQLLTHKEGVPYFEYIAAIKQNDLARSVKLADLAHNSDLSRIENPTEKDFQRLKKYATAISILKE